MAERRDGHGGVGPAGGGRLHGDGPASNGGGLRGSPVVSLGWPFQLYWFGQGLSAVGDAMTTVALPLVVLEVSHSVAAMGRLTAVARAAGFVATALAGFLVDRFSARRVMAICDVVRCGAMSLVPLSAWLGGGSLALVTAVGAVAAAGQGIFYVAHAALLVALVGRADVGRANSRVEGTIALAYVVGPYLAGVLAARVGAPAVLAVDSATFLVSALSLVALRVVVSAPSGLDRLETTWIANVAQGGRRSASSRPGAGAGPRSTSGLLAGVRFLHDEPMLWRLTLLVALWQFFAAAIVDLFIFRLKHDLMLGDAAVGATFGMASAAAVVAAAVTPTLRARLDTRVIWRIVVALQAAALLTTFRAASFATLCAGAAVFMAAMTTMIVCQASLRQEITPQPLLGRVTSGFLVLISGPAIVGALCTTALGARYGAPSVQAGIGVGLLVTAALSVRWPSSRPAAQPTA